MNYQRITYEKLEKRIEALGFPKEVAEKYSRTILNLFGFSGSIIDNKLREEEREILRYLEDYGIIGYYIDEVPLKSHKWRIVTWYLKPENIIDSKPDEEVNKAEENVYTCIYVELPDEAWERNHGGNL